MECLIFFSYNQKAKCREVFGMHLCFCLSKSLSWFSTYCQFWFVLNLVHWWFPTHRFQVQCCPACSVRDRHSTVGKSPLPQSLPPVSQLIHLSAHISHPSHHISSIWTWILIFLRSNISHVVQKLFVLCLACGTFKLTSALCHVSVWLFSTFFLIKQEGHTYL